MGVSTCFSSDTMSCCGTGGHSGLYFFSNCSSIVCLKDIGLEVFFLAFSFCVNKFAIKLGAAGMSSQRVHWPTLHAWKHRGMGLVASAACPWKYWRGTLGLVEGIEERLYVEILHLVSGSTEEESWLAASSLVLESTREEALSLYHTLVPVGTQEWCHVMACVGYPHFCTSSYRSLIPAVWPVWHWGLCWDYVWRKWGGDSEQTHIYIKAWIHFIYQIFKLTVNLWSFQ